MPIQYLRAGRDVLMQRARNLRVRTWNDLAHHERMCGASIALVGNAGYLAEVEQGERIESHDLVIRMNNFRTTGFERNVGQRTDIFLTNFWRDIDFSNPDAASAELVVSSSPNNFLKHRSRGVALRHGPLITAGMRQMGRREVFVPDLKWFFQRIDEIGRYPTTGAVGILLIVEQLLKTAEALFITGFSFFEGRSHYFSNRDQDTGNHNLDREKLLLQELLLPMIASGRVTTDELMRDRLHSSAAA